MLSRRVRALVSAQYIWLSLPLRRRLLQARQAQLLLQRRSPRKQMLPEAGHSKECGIEEHVDLRVGDLLEALKINIPEVDLLLLLQQFPLLLRTQPALPHNLARDWRCSVDRSSMSQWRCVDVVSAFARSRGFTFTPCYRPTRWLGALRRAQLHS